jgi:NAD(P)-dependent dehydrogenase (short-subunit alcohol dehydrogenase family)
MESFKDKLAVVTGGGTGMGRELVLQLAADGCAVATCDVHADTLAETASRASGAKVTTHSCDVSDESQVLRFRDEVLEQHATDHINLLFNNAGIGGGGSFINDDRASWERTFGIDWGGVYNCCRAFVPLVIASDDGYIVNTSSVNGFWASLGPQMPHTAYSAAKFAVKGFTEALITDLRVNAPHVKCAVVMPGHIGTDIVNNSRRVHGQPAPEDMSEADLEATRALMKARGLPADQMDDATLRSMIQMMADGFRDNAPVTAAQAATIILNGVREGRWRILVGDDAVALDEAVRANPEGAYAPEGPGLATVFREPARTDAT